MKCITFRYKDQELPGILDGEEVIPLRGFADMTKLIEAGIPEELPDERIPLSEILLLAPIIRPAQDVICLGMNFADHTQEARRFHPNMVRENYAVYFSKRVHEMVPPGGKIRSHPKVTQQLDYEAEVAAIIGREAYCVTAAEARDYVFGYTILNDISAREVQNRHKQFYLGKSLDGFTPMGPCIVTADEFPFPPRISIRSYINGELRQDGNTGDWIYGLEEVIEELSAGMTLRAGTIISMGTPAGVGMGFTPPKYLKSGDTVLCRAEGIGDLENTVE